MRQTCIIYRQQSAAVVFKGSFLRWRRLSSGANLVSSRQPNSRRPWTGLKIAKEAHFCTKMVNMRHLFIFLLGIIFRPVTFYLPFGGYLPYFRIFVPRLFVLHLCANGFVLSLSISHDSIVHQFFRSFFQLSSKTKKSSRRNSAAEKWKTKLTQTKNYY